MLRGAGGTPVAADLSGASFVYDADVLDRYARDLTGRFSGIPLAVARPARSKEVAEVLRTCGEQGVAVVPRGGGTGLVGGAIAAEAEIVLSLERLRHVGGVERGSSTVVAGAGATLQQIRAAAEACGLEFPIDFAARGSATVGGMVATDAGGALVMRHGTMRDLVAGLEVVLADGSILDRVRGAPRGGSGFDLTRLMAGSEGTLGVVTAARLRLVPGAAHRTVALLACDSLDGAVAATLSLRDRVPSVEAVDFFLPGGLDLVMRHTRLPPLFPGRGGAYLVVSCSAPHDPERELAAAVADLAGVRDAAVAQSADQRARLWSYRELHAEAVAAAGVPHKLDVAVAPERVPELVDRIDAWLADDREGAAAIYYGHLAAGTVHVNVLGAARDDAPLDEAVLRIVADMRGGIAAEHGVGRAKNRWLHLARSPGEIAGMAAVKRALDPRGILNPGKLLPPGS
ncbi:MAG: FAD-binding oxidoreductase [Actinomycetota bacterium]